MIKKKISFRIITFCISAIFTFNTTFQEVYPVYADETGLSSDSIIDLQKIIRANPSLGDIKSINQFMDFVSSHSTGLSAGAQKVIDETLERFSNEDKDALRLTYVSVSPKSEIFNILPSFRKLAVKTLRINYKNKWQTLMFINTDETNSRYLKFSIERAIQHAIYLTRHELIKRKFPETKIFPLSSGALLALGKFHYTITLASAQYAPSFDCLMVDVVGWLTSGFPIGSRIKLLREVLPHEEAHMRFFRLSKDEQDSVIMGIFNDLGKDRIEEIYNVIGFWHEQDKPGYYSATEEMVEFPEWFRLDEMIDMPGAKGLWVTKLSSGKNLNLAIFVTELLSTISMDLASISRIHGVPREFVNRLKALYDKEKGIGFDVNKELSKKTRTLLKNFNLLSPDISEHLSLISVQYPYLILEECWKGYFTDYDLEEIIGLSYAKNILRKNGFSESEVNIIRPAIKKYWLILKRRGRQFTALEEIPTLAQWMILILAALKTRGKADRAIDKITEDLKKVSKNNMHLGNNIPLSLLISKRKSSERARQIKKMMGELNKIGFVRRLTKDVKDGNISTMLDMTLLAKYICSIKTGGAISLRLALEEHIERALAKESRLIVDLDLETLLSVDKEGSVNFKDIYFSDAINLLRTITKDRLSIRLIDFSAGKYSNKIEKALELRQFNGTASLISAEDVGFELRDEAIKIAYEGNVNKFNVRPDVITKGNDMYFEGRNVEVISAFDAVLSSLVVFCGRDFGFLHFLREFLDTMPDRYKVYENDKDLINITLPKIPDELILKEYLIKLTSNE